MTDMTIRDLLSGLSRDPAAQADFLANPDGYLSAHGFDLPEELLGEAIVNVAATLPPETAEHLSAFTIAHSPIPRIDGGTDAPGGEDGSAGLGAMGGLGLLASAPLIVDEATDTNADVEGPDPSGFGEGSWDGVEPQTSDGVADSLDQAIDGEAGVDIDEPAMLESDGDGLDGDGPLGAGGETPAGDGVDGGSGEFSQIDPRDPADLDDLDGLE